MESLFIEGYFSKIEGEYTQEEYDVFYESINLNKNIKVGTVNISGCKTPKNVYLSDICNIIEENNMDYGNCVWGELYMKLSKSKIDKLSENNFEDVDLPDCYKVVINGTVLYFFPIRWLY